MLPGVFVDSRYWFGFWRLELELVWELGCLGSGDLGFGAAGARGGDGV